MMKAEDIMTTEVVTIRGSATVAEAVDSMKYKGLRSLIVEPRTENRSAERRAGKEVRYVRGAQPEQQQIH